MTQGSPWITGKSACCLSLASYLLVSLHLGSEAISNQMINWRMSRTASGLTDPVWITYLHYVIYSGSGRPIRMSRLSAYTDINQSASVFVSRDRWLRASSAVLGYPQQWLGISANRSSIAVSKYEIWHLEIMTVFNHVKPCFLTSGTCLLPLNYMDTAENLLDFNPNIKTFLTISDISYFWNQLGWFYAIKLSYCIYKIISVNM